MTYRSPPTTDDPLPHYSGLDHSQSELEWCVRPTQVNGQSSLSLTKTVAGVKKRCCDANSMTLKMHVNNRPRLHTNIQMKI